MKKALVVYDSSFGNTAKIAEAIAGALGTDALLVTTVDYEDLRGSELVIFGSPTQGGAATPFLQEYLKQLPDDIFLGTKVAAFDTRYDSTKQKLWLRVLMKTIGYAAAKILSELSSRGGKVTGEAVGFIVEGREGPLRDGELKRAVQWAQRL